MWEEDAHVSLSAVDLEQYTALIPATRRPGMRPVHPGEILAEALEEGLHLSVSKAARRLRVTRRTLHRIIAGRTGVTAEMALRLGKLCGNGPDIWMALLARYDLASARPGLAAALERIPRPGDPA